MVLKSKVEVISLCEEITITSERDALKTANLVDVWGTWNTVNDYYSKVLTKL